MFGHCGKDIKFDDTGTAFRDHFIKVHGSTPGFQCLWIVNGGPCGSNHCSHIGTLHTHVRDKHLKLWRVPCEYCGNAFRAQYELNRHTKSCRVRLQQLASALESASPHDTETSLQGGTPPQSPGTILPAPLSAQSDGDAAATNACSDETWTSQSIIAQEHSDVSSPSNKNEDEESQTVNAFARMSPDPQSVVSRVSYSGQSVPLEVSSSQGCVSAPLSTVSDSPPTMPVMGDEFDGRAPLLTAPQTHMPYELLDLSELIRPEMITPSDFDFLDDPVTA